LYRQRFHGSTQNILLNRHFVELVESFRPAHRSTSV